MTSEKTLSTPSFLRLILGVLGLGLAALAFQTYQSTRAFLETAQEARATVSRIEWSSSRDSKGRPTRMAYSVYEFEINGKTYAGKSTLGSTSPSHLMGESIVVLYDPSNPSVNQIRNLTQQWLKPIALGAAGALLGFLAFAIKGAQARQHPSLGAND